MHLHHTIPNPLKKYATDRVVKSALVLTIAVSTVAWLTNRMMRTADAQALPAGFFFFQSTAQDKSGAHAFRVMDVENRDHEVTGFVQLNQPTMRDSQLWKEVVQVIRFDGKIFGKWQNKLTEQCLADESLDELHGRATIRPCSDEMTFWQKIAQQDSANRVVFRRTTPLSGPFPDIKVCLSKFRFAPQWVSVVYCPEDTFPDELVWEATSQPLATVQLPSTPDSPPASPPLTPTGCKLFGTTATCGRVGFNCNPFSAADKIVVASGRIGVAVTEVEARLGLVNGTYLNEGKASVAVCATRAGMASCGNLIDVTFGPTQCSFPNPPSHTCPTGQIDCGFGCRPPSDPECHPK